MRYDEYLFTSIGGKSVNEDSIRFCKTPGGIVAVVADGVGSNGGGDIASSICADMIKDELPNCREKGDIFSLIKRANKAVIAHQTTAVQMKSTIVTVDIRDERTTFVHAGDSRGYVFRDSKLLFQTFDHSIPQMDVLRGNITLEQIRFHPNRNKILRALGIDDVIPEISGELKLKEGDAILLCTDGFWEYVTEEEMAVDLAKSKSASVWTSYMLERIGKRIGSDNDNLSAIAIICG
ncbi:MAG: protein phosphatase 2C domain-containing protein [Ruminococcus sp.]|jgi:serine/threonine protein phosphatase PrpC|nr:protein phosphatase 2C domain-containing protein [Ruminococcus sp.]